METIQDLEARVEVRRGEYHDSVTLLLATRAVAAVPGVAAALVAMGTELNLELLAGLGFAVPAPVGVNDLIVAVALAVGDEEGGGDSGGDGDGQVAAAARAALAAALSSGSAVGGAGAAEGSAGSSSPGGTLPSRTVRSALRRTGGSLALISTPGPAATVECMDALEEGASAIVFSDNVPLDHELRLKEEAHRRGLLVMGPDCGTVVLDGVGYGFANVVRPGPVSLVAASGTGAQQVMSLLDAAGVGTRHCLGVGGRDLTAAIGGRSTLTALTTLDADPDTGLIILVAKPPDPATAARVADHAATLTTPVVSALIGPDRPDLTAAVEDALRRLGRPVPAAWAAWAPTTQPLPEPMPILGFFSGGTLCSEARTILRAADIDASALTDFGDDAYTRGRPHPMIDNTLRVEAMGAAIASPTAAVLLLDVVLGRGAHADPAGELAPTVAAARARGRAVVVSLCGTAGDPQGLERQARVLADAGALVHLSNAEAARAAVRLSSGGPA